MVNSNIKKVFTTFPDSIEMLLMPAPGRNKQTLLLPFILKTIHDDINSC
jgi:hypothetical protein